MPHLLQERADEGHRTDFHFRNEPVRDTQTEHQRQHVEVTRMIRRIDFCARRFHMLLADDAHRASYEREQDLESGRGEASRLLVILDNLHYRPGRNNPQGKHHTEIQTVENRSEEHTSELQSLAYLVCRLLLEKKKKTTTRY